MGFVIEGVTLISQNPWTDEQRMAVQRACREALHARYPEQPPSEEEVAAYWQSCVEAPHSAVVYGQVAPYSAYWQFYDSDPECGLLYEALQKHCGPLGMTITSHFSC
jgi:hypothetical protein